MAVSAGVRPRATLASLPTELHALIARLIYLDSIPSGSLCTLDPLTLPNSNPLADGSDPVSARPLASNQNETRKTLYALCLTSRSFYVAARPLLFRRVVVTLPHSFVLVLRTLGAAHLAQVYDKYAASGNQDFLLRDPATTLASGALGSELQGQLVKRKRERTVTFEEMVAAAGFAHAAGGTLVVKARSKAALERPQGRLQSQPAIVQEPGSTQPSGSAYTAEADNAREMDLVWIEDPTSKSKSKRYHVHLAPFKPTALTLSNEELFAAHRFVRMIDFSRYTSQGMRRSVGDSSKNRFVTPSKLLALITAVSEFLESFGASETMDSALTCEILEALLFRDGEWAKPSHLRGVSIERRRSVSRHRGTSMSRVGSANQRDSDHKMLQSLDLCNCVSPRFGEAFTRFVQLYLRPRAVGITADDVPDIEPPSGPLEIHAEEEDATTSTETETETEVETETDGDSEVDGGRPEAAQRRRTVTIDEEEEDEEMMERGRDTRSRRIFGSQAGSNSRSRSRTPFAGASAASSSSSATATTISTPRTPSQSRLSGVAGGSARLGSPSVRTTSLTRNASQTRSRSTAFTPATFPSLRRLGMNGITFPMDIVTPFVLAFPHLTHLDLSRSKTDGALLRALAASDTLALQSLSLARCRSIDSESILELVVRSDVCASLVELNLEGTLIFPTSITRPDAMTLIKEAPAIKSGAMRYLDLSGCNLTDAHLAVFAAQPSMLDLGLGCNPRITLQGVATLLKEKAPNVQVLDLADSCTATSDDTGGEYDDDFDMADGPPIFGSAGGSAVTAVQLHQQLLAPCCLAPPVPLSQQLAEMGFNHLAQDPSSSSGGTAPSNLTPPRPPTNLRVIELGASSLRSIRSGIETWKVVWGAGQRGWIVDMAAGPNPQAVFQKDTDVLGKGAEAEADGRGRGRTGQPRRASRAGGGGLGGDLGETGRRDSPRRRSSLRQSSAPSNSRSRSRARSTSRVRAPGRMISLDTDEDDDDDGGEERDEDDGVDDRRRGAGMPSSLRGSASRFGRVDRTVVSDDEDDGAAASARAGDTTLHSAPAPEPAPTDSSAHSGSTSAAPTKTTVLTARNEVVRGLPPTHPRREALEALGRAKGHVPGDTGWHSRKMEILLGFGFMGREAGSYAMVAYQT
ncbi:unnamed protein product [Tilletia laevis]|uniref:Uncharacterized protein n=2 Tax=Tilletia TaxID=13289 RepID=A0A177VBG5_9BASI|nr:hypothetical protein CF336_g1346 [Tilletia laevis]KAE8264273.1 hypothetical protein A4X03_0g1065 [Tilletia caries]CAD6921994.1 unnamed protein product [Tilletia controversa]KAE8207764.1 hypothetical protein CF335_g899 [Tilletia laevis]CAD6889025.1 unnamed protein product [Tilletia caries]